MKAGLKSPHRSEVERQEVEKQCPVRLGRKAYELAFSLRGGRIIYVLQIGGFPAKARPVINYLAIDLARCVVDERQGLSSSIIVPASREGVAPGGYVRVGAALQLNSASMSSSVISANGDSSVRPKSRSRFIFVSIESNIIPISAVARLTRNLTSPRLDLSSKITTRM